MRPRFDAPGDPYAHYAIDVNNLANAQSAAYGNEDDDPYNMNNYTQFLGNDHEEEDDVPNESAWVLSALQQYDQLPASLRRHISDDYLDDDEPQSAANAEKLDVSIQPLQATTSAAVCGNEPDAEPLNNFNNDGTDTGNAKSTNAVESASFDNGECNNLANANSNALTPIGNAESIASIDNIESAPIGDVGCTTLVDSIELIEPLNNNFNFESSLIDNTELATPTNDTTSMLLENIDPALMSDQEPSNVAVTFVQQDFTANDILSHTTAVQEGTHQCTDSNEPCSSTSVIDSTEVQATLHSWTASPETQNIACYQPLSEDVAPSLTPDGSPSSQESLIGQNNHDSSLMYVAPANCEVGCQKSYSASNQTNYPGYPDPTPNDNFSFGDVNFNFSSSTDNTPPTLSSDAAFSPPLLVLNRNMAAVGRVYNNGPKGRAMKSADGSVKNQKKPYNALNQSRKTFRENRVATAEGYWGKKIIEVMTVALAPRAEPQGYHKAARGANAPVLNPLDYGDHYLNHIQDLAKLTTGKPDVAAMLFKQQVEVRLNNQVAKKAARHNNAGELLLKDLREVKLAAITLFPGIIAPPATKERKAKKTASGTKKQTKRKASASEEDEQVSQPKRVRVAGGLKPRRGRTQVTTNLEIAAQSIESGVSIEEGNQIISITTGFMDEWSFSPVTDAFPSAVSGSQIADKEHLLSAELSEDPFLFDEEMTDDNVVKSIELADGAPMGNDFNQGVCGTADQVTQSAYVGDSYNQSALDLGDGLTQHTFGDGFNKNVYLRNSTFDFNDFALGNVYPQNVPGGVESFDQDAFTFGDDMNTFDASFPGNDFVFDKSMMQEYHYLIG